MIILITRMTLASEHKNKNYQGKDPCLQRRFHLMNLLHRIDQNDQEIAEEVIEKKGITKV